MVGKVACVGAATLKARDNLKTVAITQARLGSTRLPNKVLLEVEGKSLLAHHVERVRRSNTVDEVAVATTDLALDDPIAAWCQDSNIRCVRGSENDVLGRYVLAANSCNADIIVRVTSDCPLIDPAVIDRTVGAFCQSLPTYDYACNRLPQSYPRGLDTEVTTREVLLTADREAKSARDREHVTLFIWRQPDRFRLLNVPHRANESRYRWTVDTEADFELIRRMIPELVSVREDYDLQNCLDCMALHPQWSQLNELVEQKDLDAYDVVGDVDQWNQ